MVRRLSCVRAGSALSFSSSSTLTSTRPSSSMSRSALGSNGRSQWQRRTVTVIQTLWPRRFRLCGAASRSSPRRTGIKPSFYCASSEVSWAMFAGSREWTCAQAPSASRRRLPRTLRATRERPHRRNGRGISCQQDDDLARATKGHGSRLALARRTRTPPHGLDRPRATGRKSPVRRPNRPLGSEHEAALSSRVKSDLA